MIYDESKFLVPNITFFDPRFNEKKQVSKASIIGKNVPGDNPQLLSTTVASNKFVYDMVMFTHDTAEEFPAGVGMAGYGTDFGIIHFDEADGFGYQANTSGMKHNELKEAYSDHRPLWIRFRADGEWFDGSWD